MRQQQSKDGAAVVGSSIVLLQERFKQLQRLKEMREGKQQLLLIRQPQQPQPSMADGCDAAAGFTTSDHHDPLALGLGARYRVVEGKFGSGGGGRGLFEKPDVDTSLRL